MLPDILQNNNMNVILELVLHKCIYLDVCRNKFNLNILGSIHYFNMARLEQCCLYHDLPLPLPLLCNQAVASETSRMASYCVAKKKET